MNISDLAMVKTVKLSRRFDSFKALDNVNLTVGPGESLAIFGHNGAGKTTLLKILAGVMKPTSGEVFVNGINLSVNPDEARVKLGALSHRTYLYAGLTAHDNLAFYCRLYGVNNPEGRISELLGRLGLKTRMYERVGTFSRGMQQRVAIARALLHKPEIVLMDEPETGLDIRGSETLWKLLSEETRTVIFTHHSLERGFEHATRTAVLSRGKLVFCPETSCTFSGLADAYTESLESL